MNFEISTINFRQNLPAFKQESKSVQRPKTSEIPENIMPIYGNDKIRTNPAQLSLFFMHDFHGQNIRMERAYNAATQFDRGTLQNQHSAFDNSLPIDSFKVASGDMFLGENEKELRAVNEFLNIAGIVANTIGNHECDAGVKLLENVVSDRKYRLLGANMHPDIDSKMSSILSESFIINSNGNKYGFIGLVPPDMPKHLKRPEEAEEFHISDMEGTIRDLQEEVNKLKQHGVNKIIVLSHTGFNNEKYIAQNVSDVDIILGGHTHNFIGEVKEGENLFNSPKGEPVLIMQIGRDGEHIGIPNVVFNELGQITKIQYNVINTDEFSRSLVAKNSIEKVLGKPEVVGRIDYIEKLPKDIYAYENPNCDFITDCMREELNTDIAIMNSANIRGQFHRGNVDTRDLELISPFGNKMCVIKVSEAELVDRFDDIIERTMESEFHRPGIFQVSGLKYEYSKSEGELTKMSFIDRDGKECPIDIENPREDKFYTIAIDDYCAQSDGAGLNLKHRFEESDIHFDFDKNKLVENYLKKQNKPVTIKTDNRIRVVD